MGVQLYTPDMYLFIRPVHTMENHDLLLAIPNCCWMMTVCRTRLLQDDAIEKCYIVGCYTYRQNGANLKASLQAYSQSVYIREALRVILAF